MIVLPSPTVILSFAIPVMTLMMLLLLLSRIKRYRRGGRVPDRWTTMDWFILLALVGIFVDPINDPDTLFVWRVTVTLLFTFLAFRVIDALAAWIAERLNRKVE